MLACWLALAEERRGAREPLQLRALAAGWPGEGGVAGPAPPGGGLHLSGLPPNFSQFFQLFAFSPSPVLIFRPAQTLDLYPQEVLSGNNRGFITRK